MILSLLLLAMDENKSTYSQGKILLLLAYDFPIFLEILECFDSLYCLLYFSLWRYTKLTLIMTFPVKAAVSRCPPSWWSCTSCTSRRLPAGTRRRPTTWRSSMWCWGWELKLALGWDIILPLSSPRPCCHCEARSLRTGRVRGRGSCLPSDRTRQTSYSRDKNCGPSRTWWGQRAGWASTARRVSGPPPALTSQTSRATGRIPPGNISS